MSPAKNNMDGQHIIDTHSKSLLSENNKKEDHLKKSGELSLDEINKTKSLEEKPKMELPLDEELLGSVTTLSSPAVRTSARVIQKLKMDSIRPASPPLPDKKDSAKDDRPVQKTPNQPKPIKVIWTNIERNLFFEAINEYGKDFEGISHYVNSKQKRKTSADPTYKTKEHVRQLYHQTFHKVAKYLRFSEDIKKHVQELYALINYGEMRKKLVFINQKDCMKLKELVYKGSVTLRVKGKNIRIKTPSCKALRKLNQMEEWQEEIKLPTKIDVFLKPANIDSWGRVQNLAQNPRVKTILPLQKRVLSLLKTLQTRWRSREARLCDQTMTLSNVCIQGQKQANTDIKNTTEPETLNCIKYLEPFLCFAPSPNAVIHRPMVNLTEFLSSYSICLNSYEERIGVTVRGESLCTERLNTLKEIIKTNSKRQRHDSGSEKKSPECKRSKSENDIKIPEPKPEDIIDTPKVIEHILEEKYDSDYVNLMKSNIFEIDGITQLDISKVEIIDNEESNKNGCSLNTEQLQKESSEIDTTKEVDIISENTTIVEQKKETVIPEITIKAVNENKTKRKESKCHTYKKKDVKKEPFRPLLSEEVIQEIKKGWTLLNVGDLTIGDLYIMFGQDFKVNLVYSWIDHKEEISNEEISFTSETELKPNPTKNSLGGKLKQLLVLANMTEKTKKKANCACGHFCDRGFKIKKKDEVFPRSFISNKIYPSSVTDNGVFRQPVLPLRSGLSHIEAYKLNLNNARNKQSRWLKTRNSRPSKQVVVQRLLPLLPGVTHSYGVVSTQVEYLKNTSRSNDISKLLDIEEDLTISKSNNNEENKSDPLDKSDNTDIQIEVKSESNCQNSSNSNNDSEIKSLMELSLPSPAANSNLDEYFIYNTHPSMSPMGILRESPTDSRWFEENINDFSLSSFLGHLDSACDVEKKTNSVIREVDSSNLSAISDTSIDYITKFEELAQSMKNEE